MFLCKHTHLNSTQYSDKMIGHVSKDTNRWIRMGRILHFMRGGWLWIYGGKRRS